MYYFKSFADPVDAARCYNKEATKLCGAAATLNVLPGCSPCPTNDDAPPCTSGTTDIVPPILENQLEVSGRPNVSVTSWVSSV